MQCAVLVCVVSSKRSAARFSILDRINVAGARFRSLTEPIDTTNAAGQLMLHMLAAFAQFEWSMIRERSMAGQRAARERGVRLGPPRRLDYARICELRAQGLSTRKIGLAVGTSSAGVCYALKSARERGL